MPSPNHKGWRTGGGSHGDDTESDGVSVAGPQPSEGDKREFPRCVAGSLRVRVGTEGRQPPESGGRIPPASGGGGGQPSANRGFSPCAPKPHVAVSPRYVRLRLMCYLRTGGSIISVPLSFRHSLGRFDSRALSAASSSGRLSIPLRDLEAPCYGAEDLRRGRLSRPGRSRAGRPPRPGRPSRPSCPSRRQGRAAPPADRVRRHRS